jgi:hypothetical protein
MFLRPSDHMSRRRPEAERDGADITGGTAAAWCHREPPRRSGHHPDQGDTAPNRSRSVADSCAAIPSEFVRVYSPSTVPQSPQRGAPDSTDLFEDGGLNLHHRGTSAPVSDNPIEQPDQPDDMDDADTANGENPDKSATGERQAEENRDNDPPA